MSTRKPPRPTWITWLSGRAFLTVGVLLMLGALALPAWRLTRPPDEPPPEPEMPLLLPETPLLEEVAPDESEAEPTPRPTPEPFVITPREEVRPPERLVIPAIDLDATVEPVGWIEITLNGETFGQWQVPDGGAVGWHDTSAGVGQSGNTVLNGHHNLYGQVFRRLVELNAGDSLSLWTGDSEYTYVVTQVAILPERGQPIEVRLANAAYILPTDDERLTLVTCWPYSGNSHRLIVVAKPIARYDLFFGDEFE